MATKRDVYREVTDRIVAALDAGVVPWVRPWTVDAASAGPDRNALTGRPYSGTNVILLWLTRMERGYTSPLWITFRQAQQLGGHVRRGERGTTVVFWSATTVANDAEPGDDKPDERRVVWARSYTVFNVAQCDGLPESTTGASAAEVGAIIEHRVERCETFVAATGARVIYGGSVAGYRPATDTIHMPPFAAFESAEHFCATLLHELAHWTAHPSRCDRQLGKRFGDSAYCVEELIAELASAFVCDHVGIQGQLRHADYIGHWLRVLRADKRAIFTAASRARSAVEFLLDQSPANRLAA